MKYSGLICISNGFGPKPIPLKNVKIEANVVDMIAEVIISQTYTNVENDTIEAIYKFPIHEAAAVCAFEAEIDGKTKVKGIIKETEEAVKEYNTAIQEGHGAFLMNSQLPDVFECMVGNILPKQTVVINITYVTELKHDAENEKIRFVLPTSIAPRYGSNGPSDIPSFASNLPLVNTVDPIGHLSISVTCRMTSSITSIESPSHYVSTELNIDGNTKISRITLNEQINYLDKDFVLVVKSQGLDQPRAFIEYNPETETNCVMLTLVPKFAINPILTEMIFVVDRSGSMNGDPIKKAAQALELFLRSLPEDSYFNVVSFGSTYDSLFPKSQPNSQSAISTALSLAQNMEANYGGTEIYQCLKWVFENKRNDMPTAVVLLTDGSVWNVNQIVELIQSKVKESKDLRLFSLGIGNNVSHNLVEAAARAGKGYAQFVTDCNDGFEKKIIGFLKNSLRPPIKDYKIDWTEYEVMEVEDVELSKNDSEKPVISFFNQNDESPPQLPPTNDFIPKLQFRQAPYDIPPIYQGVRLMVYCILSKGIEPKQNITLSAMSQDGPMKLEIPVDPVTLQGSKIHTLAARKLIQNLEDGTSFLHNHQKYQGKQVPNSIVRKQIISLGKTYSLASRYTSFIAIEERDIDMTKEQDYKPLQRVVPNYIPPNYRSRPSAFGTNSSWFNSNAPSSGGLGSLVSSPAVGMFGSQKPAFGFGSIQSRQSPVSSVSLFGSAQSPTPAFGIPPIPVASFSNIVQLPTPAFGFGSAQSQPSAFGSQSQPSAFGSQSQPSAIGFSSPQIQPCSLQSTFRIGSSQPQNLQQSTNSGQSAFRLSSAQAQTLALQSFALRSQPPNQPQNQPNLSQFGGFAVSTNAPQVNNLISSSTPNQSQSQLDRFGGFAVTTLASQEENESTNFSDSEFQFNEFLSNIPIQSPNYQKVNVEQQAFTSDSTNIPKQQNNPTIPSLETLYSFLRFQSFDGKFLPSDEFYSYFKKDEVENNELKEYGIRNSVDETIWTTSVAIGYLEIIMGSKFGEESDLCKEKAERWLEKMSGSEKMKVLEIAKEWVREWVKRWE
ncbi:von Willebrand factor type A domain-containing protein [Gigaspora rosea]|uniref:von Willebrand factor type A domain-containing protein n=1 Tax=Gigaspora rosea TaxID=44941 RepID=A0A397UFR8_9GLOM|nr:von Willebrand factor type A domain-containing protein [Gigaspora rosea]